MKLISNFSLAFLCTVVLFTSCKKEDDSQKKNESDEVSAAVTDDSQVTSETDAIALDAGAAIEFEASFSGNNSVVDQLICDASVEYNTASDPMTITITYNGSNCGQGRKRTGSIVLAMAQGTEWKNAGASFTITFNELTIKKGNKSITLTGTHNVTNVSGGLLINLATSGPIIHTVTSDNMKVSFDNGAARNWHVAKQRVYTYNNGAVLTISGTHTAGTEVAVAEWGTNRHGVEFATSTLVPVEVKQSCNFRVTGGSVKHSTEAFAAIVTFGLDAGGESIDCPGTGNYFYKLVWTGRNGGSVNLIMPY